MYLAYVLPGLSIGGGVNVVLEHAERLARRGHRVAVISTEDQPQVTWRTAAGVELVSIHHVEDLLHAFEALPDVLVATGWQTVYEIAWRRLPARSYGYFVQAFEPDFYPADSFDADLAAATYTLGFSYLSEARWLVEKLATTYGHEVTYARNGLNDHFHQRATPIQPRGDRFRVLLEGPLGNPWKRMDDAFLAVQDLDAEVWLVTSSGELAPWQKPDRVFRDVPLSVMPSIYASCDVMLKLSSAEGMFGPPLEMMSQGGVPITSDVVGHDEFMRDGVNGLVVPVGDWAGARQAVKDLIVHRELLHAMAAAGLATASEFRWEPTMDVVENWLRATAERGRPDDGPDIFRLARLGTRVYMSRAWDVGSLDGRQRLHTKLEHEPAITTPTKREMIVMSGWLATRNDESTWAVDETGHHILHESWRDRRDVLQVLPKFRAAHGFALSLLTADGLSKQATVDFVSSQGERRSAVLQAEAKQSRDKGIYLDDVRSVPCLAVSHPGPGRDLRLEVVGGDDGDDGPQAFVEVRDPDGNVGLLRVDVKVERGVRQRPTWVLDGLAFQRFLGDARTSLFVASPGFAAHMRWTQAA